NQRASDDPKTFEPFAPETVLEYEVGLKETFLGGRARWNTAAFYDDYKQIQRTIVIPGTPNSAGESSPISIVGNAASATIYGGETELSVSPLTGLTIQGGIGISIARYDTFDGGIGLGDLSSELFVNAPDYTASGLVSYTLPPSLLGAK